MKKKLMRFFFAFLILLGVFMICGAIENAEIFPRSGNLGLLFFLAGIVGQFFVNRMPDPPKFFRGEEMKIK